MILKIQWFVVFAVLCSASAAFAGGGNGEPKPKQVCGGGIGPTYARGGGVGLSRGSRV